MSEQSPSIEQRVAQLERDLKAFATDMVGIKSSFKTIQTAVAKAGDEFKLIFDSLHTKAEGGKRQIDAFKAQSDRISDCLRLMLGAIDELAKSEKLQAISDKILEAQKALFGGKLPSSTNN